MVDETARAKANVPRPCKKQPLTGLDTYHRLLREASLPTEEIERPYHGHTRSFSIPRPSPTKNPAGSPPASSTSSDTIVANSKSFSPKSTNEWPTYNAGIGAFGEKRTQTAATTTTTSSSSRSPSLEKEEKTPDAPPPLPPLPWRPFYLRRRVLVSFAVLFAALIATAQALLAFSNQHAGLGSPGRIRYLWQYGGTAIITIIATIWTRVEFQSKFAAPWIRMSRGPSDAERTMLLDYITVFQPLSIIKALKNKDVLVAGLSFVSLILRVLIVVATSLVTRSRVDLVDAQAGLTLTTTFVNDNSGLRNVGSLPVYSLVGLTTRNLSFPDGTSSKFAYQAFESDDGSKVKATVDGFIGSLECEAAGVRLDGLQLDVEFFTRTNLTVASPDCEMVLSLTNTAFLSLSARDLGATLLHFARGGCDGSEAQEDQRVAAIMAEIDIDFDTISSDPAATNVPFDGTLLRSTAIICKPNYSIPRVQVVKNGTDLISVIPVGGGSSKTLSNVTPIDLLDAQDISYASSLVTGRTGSGPFADVQSIFSNVTAMDMNVPMSAAVYLRSGTGAPPTVDDLRDINFLRDLVVDYYEQYTALIAGLALVEDANIPTTGEAIITGDRLLVQPLTVHLASSLLAVCLVLAVGSVFIVPKKGILPRAPNSVIDVATLVAHSRPLLQSLRGTGAADMKTIRGRLKNSQFSIAVDPYERPTDTGLGYFKIRGGDPPPQGAPPSLDETGHWGDPIVLHHWSRLSAVIVVAGIIAALEILLRMSDANGGIADIQDGDNIHLLWTTAGPALVLGLVALYYQSVDSDTRVLAPYVSLLQGNSFARSVGLDFLDMSRPRIFWQAFRTRNLTVAATGLTVVLCGTLAIFASGLFDPVPVPLTAQVALRTTDYFSNTTLRDPDGVGGTFCFMCENAALVASLILRGNLTFPKFTFGDLAFQTLEFQDPSALSTVIPNEASASELTVAMKMPAVRPRLTCKVHPASEITTNLTLNGYDIVGIKHPLRIDIASEICSNVTAETLNHVALFPTAPGLDGLDIVEKAELARGVTFGRVADDTSRQCSDFVWVWGSLANAGTNDTTVTNVGAVSCNETMEVVDVDVRFHGTDLRIDPEDPPVVDESSAADTQVAVNSDVYFGLANVSTTELYDPFFTLLTTSLFAVPPSDLRSADETTLQSIADAIAHHHRIIRTQAVNEETRRFVTNGTFPAFGSTQLAPGIDPSLTPAQAQPVLPALASSTNTLSPHRRLTQDAPSTRVLQTLLSLTLLLSLTAWLLTPPSPLPRSPASLASQTALLADSNLFGALPRGAEWMPTSPALASSFNDGSRPMGFAMAWEKVRRRRREEDGGLWGLGVGGGSFREEERAFAVRVVRTGGWGGGEEAGLGIVARVGMGQRGFVRGWRNSRD